MAQVQYIGTGRRKSSVARVRLVPGDGKVIINGRVMEEYIPFAALRDVVNQPLNATETLGSYDVLVNVKGVICQQATRDSHFDDGRINKAGQYSDSECQYEKPDVTRKDS